MIGALLVTKYPYLVCRGDVWLARCSRKRPPVAFITPPVLCLLVKGYWQRKILKVKPECALVNTDKLIPEVLQRKRLLKGGITWSDWNDGLRGFYIKVCKLRCIRVNCVKKGITHLYAKGLNRLWINKNSSSNNTIEFCRETESPNKSFLKPMVGGLQSLINISACFLATVQASGCSVLSNPAGNPCRDGTQHQCNDTEERQWIKPHLTNLSSFFFGVFCNN